jgi:hypothetical protein
MVSRWTMVFACVYIAMDHLSMALERLASGYTLVRWWMLLPSAACWVWKGDVR